jgi:hypothetical protein
MPLLTEATHLRKRCVTVWLLIFALVVLPVGVVGWSCYQPVQLSLGAGAINFGRMGRDFNGTESRVWRVSVRDSALCVHSPYFEAGEDYTIQFVRRQ